MDKVRDGLTYDTLPVIPRNFIAVSVIYVFLYQNNNCQSYSSNLYQEWPMLWFLQCFFLATFSQLKCCRKR